MLLTFKLNYHFVLKTKYNLIKYLITTEIVNIIIVLKTFFSLKNDIISLHHQLIMCRMEEDGKLEK